MEKIMVIMSESLFLRASLVLGVYRLLKDSKSNTKYSLSNAHVKFLLHERRVTPAFEVDEIYNSAFQYLLSTMTLWHYKVLLFFATRFSAGENLPADVLKTMVIYCPLLLPNISTCRLYDTKKNKFWLYS
jgi:hypothetical protein